MADEKKTKTDETVEKTPVAEEKPKRTRKKAEEAAAEPAEAPVVTEEVEADAGQVQGEIEAVPEPAPEPVAEEAPAEAAPVEEPVAAESAAEEPVEEEASAAATATDEAATEQPRGPQRGPKKKSKRLPRAQRHKHAKARRESTGERKPITRLPKPESERGRSQQRRGVVVSAAMDKTIVVRVDSVKSHPKYKKVIRRSVKFHAHDEQNQAKAGDVVRIVETRPISKTKTWRLAQVLEEAK